MVRRGQRQHSGSVRVRVAAVRRVVRSAPGGRRVKLLWAPYASSIPDTAANAPRAYFPGASQVDLVGASGYNFGAVAPLQWTEPGALFASAYTTIESLAPKPFWLAETGSTATGGDKAGWIESLASLRDDAGCPSSRASSGTTSTTPPATSGCRGQLVIAAFRSLLLERLSMKHRRKQGIRPSTSHHAPQADAGRPQAAPSPPPPAPWPRAGRRDRVPLLSERDGRPAVLAGRVRAERARPRDVDGTAGERRGRLDALDARRPSRAFRAPTTAARSTRPATTPTSCSAGST